jgi:GT2 family glycosyltransferase
MHSLITIILLVKNGEKYLSEILDAIFTQNTDFTYEVLVIDSGSRDRSKEIVKRYPVRLVEIPPKQFNHGETRNLGGRLASPQSAYLVYLSQDATPADEQWLQALIEPMIQDKQVAGVFSRHIPRQGACPSLVRQLTTRWPTGGTTRIVKRMPALEQEYYSNRIYYVSFSNTSSAIRRSVWARIPFAPVDFAEDADWADRVLISGYSIVFEPASMVIHSHNHGLLNLFRENVDHAAAFWERFRPPAYRHFGLIDVLKMMVWEGLQDWKFIWTHKPFRSQPVRQRLFWTMYAPLWHLAVGLGTYVGIRGLHRKPQLRQLLSRQERVRAS